MKKFLVVTALLSLLCPFAVTAATTSAKSANCTVNTCKLAVTAEADQGGVLLKWNFTQAGYSVSIVRDNGWRALAEVSATEGKYLDATAEYGKLHKYEINVYGEKSIIPDMSASTTATRYSGDPPVVAKVEAAKLWLINEGPYNVRVSIGSGYDNNRYEVSEIGFKVNGKAEFWLKYDPSDIYDLYPKVQLSNPGTVKLIARCKYKERSTGKVVPLKNGEGEREDKNAKVFFHKYGKDCNKHLWFDYWKKQGAIDNLNEFGDRPRYHPQCSGDELGWHAADFDRDNGYPVAKGFGTHTVNTDIGDLTFPDGVLTKFKKYKFDSLGLTPNAAAGRQNDGWYIQENIKDGKYVFGIKAAASICSHELIHKKTRNNYFVDSSGEFRYKTIPNLTDAQVEALKRALEGNIGNEDKIFIREVLNSIAKSQKRDRDGYSELCDDSDNDGVLDRDERKWHSTVGARSTDGKNKDVEYVAYYNSSSAGAHTTKDFAFPGSNVAKDYEGYEANDWRRELPSQQRMLSTFQSRAMSNSMVSKRGALLGTPSGDQESDNVTMIEEVALLPDMAEKDVTNDVTIVSISNGIATGAVGDLYSGLTFDIKLRNTSGNDFDVVIGGCLVDENDSPIIGISKPVLLSNGVETACKLIFPASSIYRSKRNGYSLKSFTVTSYEEGQEIVHAYTMDAAESDRLYAYTEFVPDAGYIDKKTLTSEKDGNSLEITVDVEIVSNGVYELFATLYNTNCEYVASARIEGLSTLGEQKQTLVFHGSEIFLSKIDGPYEVFNVELRKDGEPIDSGYHLHTTAAYSYRDFADGSETIFADAGSFRREADMVGADGLCDALNFSFAVTNLAPSDAEYVARVYLCGTNDELVCSSTKNVVLSNEVNMVNVPFRGIDIKKRGVEGPFYVSEVAIEDAESGEIVERFKPEQILIDHMLSEFGDSPVALNGEAMLAEGTGDGTFVVDVPVSAVRPGVVRARAVLVATNGTPVVSAEASREFAAGENGVFTLSFNAADINATGVRGPYEVKYLCLSTDYEGTDEVHLDDLGLGELESEFILYVDASKVDDSGDGLTPATAKATIQGAIKVAQPFDTILVADGTYESIWCGVPGVTIRSVNGPASTIIDGEGQSRCVELWVNGTEYYDEEDEEWHYVEPVGGKPVIEGFTLRNGWTSYQGAGIYDGTARNCIITGCHSTYGGGGAVEATLENCVIYGNSSDRVGGGAYYCELYGCTVSANKSGNGAGGVACSEVYNSIVYGNVGANEETNEYDYGAEWNESTFDYSCTYPLPASGEGNVDADPMLVDPIHGDVRLRSTSPCIDAASEDFVVSSIDIYGNSRVQGNAPEIGAVEGNFEDRICVSATVRGVGTVTPHSSLIAPGGSVTFTARSDAREFLAYEIDGKRVSTNPVFTLNGINDNVCITATFKPGAFYVKTDGSDYNSGVDWNHAKATIQGALDACEDGETIYVDSGVYPPFDSNNRPVTIRSIYGAAETIIDAECVGCCAFMGGDTSETNTVLIGFTLQNGVVGGAGGGARGGTLVDCRIINNRAGECGGGVYCSVASRCVISNNMVVANTSDSFVDNGDIDYYERQYRGGGAYRTLLYNCLVNDNVVNAQDITDALCRGGGTYSCVMHNCTIVGNQIILPLSDATDEDGYGAGSAEGEAYNTIIWGNLANGVSDDVYYTYTDFCSVGDEDPMFIDGGFELSEDSPCIDAGGDEYVFGSMDVVGKNRIVGDCVDIGAYEYAQEVEAMVYEIAFMPNGGDGDMDNQTCTFGQMQMLSENQFIKVGYVFMGWSLSEEGDIVYRDGQQIYNITDQVGGQVKLYAQWQPIACHFIQPYIDVVETGAAIIEVVGGDADIASSVTVYLTYNIAASADLDLAKGTVDGVAPKGGLKFPLTLSWAKGEVGAKTVTIPFKTDKNVEDDEFFTLQLAAPQGMTLGEERVCTVTIRDMNDKTLKTTVTPYKPKKGEPVSTNSVTVAAGNAKGGFVSGTGEYTSGSKLTLTAEARPGWAFQGWRLKDGDETILSDKTKWQIVVTNDEEYVAVFEKIPYVRGLADPADGGKVSGSALCPAGKKVTLKATTNKGFVFTGWCQGTGNGEQGTGMPGFDERLQKGAVEYVATTPSLVIDRSAKPAKDSATSTTITNVNEDATFYACFITSAEDKAAIAASVDGSTLDPWVSKTETHAFTTNICAGVYLEWPVAASALSETKVKVAGLPSGLKFTDKPVTSKIGSGKTAVTVTNVPANTIYGAPTAASKMDKGGNPTPSAVKFTVTTAGKSLQTYQIDTVVEPLPAWAQGTFAGGMTDGGQVSLTVSAAGKASGKALGDGLIYTLAAPYYSGFALDENKSSSFLADVTASWSYKEGSKTFRTNEVVKLVVQDNGIGGYAAVEDWFEAYTVNWKIDPWKVVGKSFDKKTRAYAILADGSFSEDEAVLTSALGADVTARVTLKFAANGTVSVSGEFVTAYNEKTKKYTTVKASSSVTLVPVDKDTVSVFIYLTPKGLAPHARCIEVPWPQE